MHCHSRQTQCRVGSAKQQPHAHQPAGCEILELEVLAEVPEEAPEQVPQLLEEALGELESLFGQVLGEALEAAAQEAQGLVRDRGNHIGRSKRLSGVPGGI